jgi:hypothetical protein
MDFTLRENPLLVERVEAASISLYRKIVISPIK